MAQNNDDLMDGDEKPTAAKAKPAAKKKGPLLLIVFGLLVMIIAPLTVMLLIKKPAEKSDSEAAVQKPAPQPVVMAIDPLVVNISGTRMTRVLRLQVHLILSEPRLEEVIKEMMPMVKDRIMSTAGRRTLDEMEGVDDRESMKRDIALEINSLIRSRMAGSVLDVAFSEFLIQ